MTAPDWSIIESRGRSGLESLEADWRRLYAQLPLRTSFLSYEACLSHLDHFMKDPDQLRCLALTDGRQVRAICLLEPSTSGVIDVEGKLRRLLGRPARRPSSMPARSRRPRHARLHQVWEVLWQWHSRQADVLCPDDEARSELIPALVAHLRGRSEGRPILIVGPAPADSALWGGLRGLKGYSYQLEPRERVNSFDCTRPFDEVRASIPRRFRQDLNRSRRRLADLEDVRFEIHTHGNGLLPALDDFLQVEASGWKGECGTQTAIGCDASKLAFVRDLATNLCDRADSCEITALYAEGHCIAASFATRTGATYSGLKIGYDETYRRVSPGHLVVEKMIERCCEDPDIERLDMVSDASWVRGWRPQQVPLQMAYIVVAGWPDYAVVATLLRLRTGLGRRIASRLRDRRSTTEPQGARGHSEPRVEGARTEAQGAR